MPQLLVVAGPHTPTLRAHVRQFLGEKGLAPARTLVLGYGRDLERVWSTPDGGASDSAPHLADPEAFFESALSQNPAAPRLLRSPDRLFLLRDVLAGVRSQLGPLRALSGTSELLRQLDLLIADARRSNVTHLPPGGDWGADLSLVWDAYTLR